ncbi:phosphotransferase [Hyphomicrobium sp. LHD-15]|uniref:phosphotransferase enzyme family protein n=1 Tax=Hyphomicrobium sp. LHD-15 TaxID=3072142 RepID=UPI0028109944|nr:phosphotransferase [Hyphomicrobium sp. LHD-15]MDQ8700682.1 phosphotransferase [Hyphomicrobium sp. LHD-15]
MSEVEVSPSNAGLDQLAERSIRHFALPPGVIPTLINISENATYRLDDPATGNRWALRIHREGYHSRAAIASELAWLAALRAAEAANVPAPIQGRDGEFIQSVKAEGLANPRNVVLFDWEAGQEPAANDVAGFEKLGETAARMHAHVCTWKRPSWFERHTWNFETSLGATPHWGRWRDGMGMTPEIERVLGETVALIERRLARIGTGPGVFNLVHGDMRLANLLMDDGTVKVIDFDDCGFSWFLYDCATTVSFFEEAPEVPELIEAWVRGYRRIGTLSPDEEAEIATFVMLRRILLVAWIGSHAETDLARSMGVAYTQGTVPLCERYLSRFGAAHAVSGTVFPEQERAR